MARVLTTGFELNVLQTSNGAPEFQSASITGSLQTSTVRSGAYAYRNNPSASVQSLNIDLPSLGSPKTGFFRFYYRIVTQPANDSLVFVVTLADATTVIMRLRGTGSGLKAMNASNTQVGSSFALSTGQWYRIEVKVLSSAAFGTIDVLVDGASVVSVTSTATNGGDIGSVQFGSSATLTHEYFIDDVAVNDTTGSYQNSYPGEGKVICLRPNGAGDSADWTRGGTDSGANWSQCDEIAPNAADYNTSGTVGQRDLFTVGASGIGASDTINCVAVTAYASVGAGTASTNIATVCKAGGATSVGSAYLVDSSVNRSNGYPIAGTNPPQNQFYVDPNSAAWTQANLDAMQIGYEISSMTGAAPAAVNAVWAMVDYTPAAAGSAAPRRTMVMQAVNRASRY